MRIALDAMGSDRGATPLVQGAVMAAKRYPCEILLVGRQHTLKRLLRHYRYTGDKIHIVPASQTVRMGEHPAESLKKKESSIAVAVRLVKEGQADAVVSAGNTGSTSAHAITTLRRLKGISRPGIATVMPTPKHPCLLLDSGANVDCKPRNLLDFAIMGSVYYEHIFGCKNPKVGLLSVGEEPTKGNELTLSVYKLLEQSSLNFVGNVEGNHILTGRADVVVCDGFVGNVVLKFGESLARMLMHEFRSVMRHNVISLAAALLLMPGLRKSRKKIDYAEYGGAPLLGLNGTCIIAHGSSSPKAVMNAIRVAMESVQHNVNRHISEELARIDKEIPPD